MNDINSKKDIDFVKEDAIDINKESKNKLRYLYYVLLCLSVYWFSNCILWIPFKQSIILGAACMLVYVPVAWGGTSFLSLSKCPLSKRKNEKFIVGGINLLIGFLSDVVVFVLVRHVPEELYKPSTFCAYILLVGVPLITGFIMDKKYSRDSHKIMWYEWVISSILTVAFVVLTFYVMRFW